MSYCNVNIAPPLAPPVSRDTSRGSAVAGGAAGLLGHIDNELYFYYGPFAGDDAE